MTKLVTCIKTGIEGPALAKPPFPGELGQRIFDHVSQQGWELWVNHQTMLINEYRLSMIEPKARQFLKEEMEKFFFGEGSQKPQGFIETKE